MSPDDPTRSGPHPHVVHTDDLAWTQTLAPEGFGAERKALGRAAGAEGLGGSLYLLQPGHTAWPRHFHEGNEEAIFVLSGTGILRLGDRDVPVRQGHWASLLAGPEHAHQLTATGEVPLVYLCVSTLRHPDVVGYPDSGKVGVFTGSAPGGSPQERRLSSHHRLDDAVGYWEGEER